MNVNKTAIIPVVSILCGAYFLITGHAVSAPVQDEFATIGVIVVGAGVSIWGVIKNHKK